MALLVERLTPADLVSAKDPSKVLSSAFERVITSGQPAILWVEEIDYIAPRFFVMYQPIANLEPFLLILV